MAHGHPRDGDEEGDVFGHELFTLILVIIAAAISYLPTSMSAIVLLQGLDNVRSASAFARFIVKVRPPSLDSNPRPTCSPHQRALTYLLERTIYEGDRTDHGHREREITQRMMDLTLRPFTGTLTYFCRLRIHARSCTERQRGCRQRGPIISQIAVMTNSRIKEEREREGFKGGARKRGTLSTSDCRRKKPRMCRLSHNTDKTRDKR